MVVHLTVNASIVNSAETFQDNVYKIHALDKALPLVEWGFIFLPIIFHAVFGFVIIAGGLPNQNKYRYAANWRYTLQRITGMIAFVFIFWHVFHLHGWFHGDWWMEHIAKPLGGAKFSPFNASSSLGLALQSFFVSGLYAIGMLSCVYHLANGIWTMGITWGVWTSPAAQKKALHICGAFGVVLAVVGLSAIGGARQVGSPEQVDKVREVENRMYDARVQAGSVTPNEHKRAEPAITTDSAATTDPAADGQ